jgi:hypothetical protein
MAHRMMICKIKPQDMAGSVADLRVVLICVVSVYGTILHCHNHLLCPVCCLQLAGASGVAQQWLLEQQRLAEEAGSNSDTPSSSSSSSSSGNNNVSNSGSSSSLGATPPAPGQQKAVVAAPSQSSSQSVPAGKSR